MIACRILGEIRSQDEAVAIVQINFNIQICEVIAIDSCEMHILIIELTIRIVAWAGRAGWNIVRVIGDSLLKIKLTNLVENFAIYVRFNRGKNLSILSNV